MRYEYSVEWKREGWAKRRKVFQTRTPAENKALIVQGRVWDATGTHPDSIYDPATGATYREFFELKSAEFPPLEYVRVERRVVGEWEQIINERQWHADRRLMEAASEKLGRRVEP